MRVKCCAVVRMMLSRPFNGAARAGCSLASISPLHLSGLAMHRASVAYRNYLSMSFASLGLSPELVRTLEQIGYTNPTPIQQQAIPFVLEGRDVLAGAQTGTG